MNMLDYVKKVKDISFEEQKMNDIDMLIFSQLTYVQLDNIDFNEKKYSVKEISKLIDKEKSKKYISSQINAQILFEEIANTKRYKDVLIYNYKYIQNSETQFGAMEIELPTKEIIVSFEGTDHTLVGWKEDAILAYQYPTEAQKSAGEYLEEVLKREKRKVYVCGHSKGGNLALVGSMRQKLFKKRKIKKIYSFDGPGLKAKEFNSFSYKTVRRKSKNIIPDTSIVGVFFYQENLIVVKSNKKGAFQHDAFSWLIEDNDFVYTTRNQLSIDLDNAIRNWMETYGEDDIKRMVDKIFGLCEEAGINSLSDINKNKFKSLVSIFKASKNLDKETKSMVYYCLKALLGDIGNVLISDEINKIKNFFKKKNQGE